MYFYLNTLFLGYAITAGYERLLKLQNCCLRLQDCLLSHHFGGGTIAFRNVLVDFYLNCERDR